MGTNIELDRINSFHDVSLELHSLFFSQYQRLTILCCITKLNKFDWFLVIAFHNIFNFFEGNMEKFTAKVDHIESPMSKFFVESIFQSRCIFAKDHGVYVKIKRY